MRWCRFPAQWALVAVAWMASPAHAATYYVDRGNGACSDVGPGTSSNPYCSISSALAAHNAPGTTILVRPGVYREQINVPASGGSSSPIVVRAERIAGNSVVVNGADSFSDPAKWSQSQGNVWRAAAVSWPPTQVLEDGVRLVSYVGDPATLPAGSFAYVSGSGLSVNAGGGNPGTHAIEVGRRDYGFAVPGRSWVTIDGFTVTNCRDGIQMTDASSGIEVTNDSITFSARFGIQASGCSSLHIAGNVVSDNADHGISVTSGTTGSTIERNESFRNIDPAVRRANGIYLFGAPGNVLRANRLHDNQDSGMNLGLGSDKNLLIENLSWNNGDHGFDQLRSSGTTLLGNVAFGNTNDGISIEGNSFGASVYNCISVNNGLSTGHYDLWVDDSSSTGFASDDNLLWNSGAQAPVRYRTTAYSTVTAFRAATGHDTRTVQANPRFVNVAAGDFHLAGGSPAIDNANSAVPGWPPQDAEGHGRGDDPATPNLGIGPIAYADRGAFEYTASGTVAVDPPPGREPMAGGRATVIPNPVRSSASLEFSLPRPGSLSVGLFDLGGRLVRSLVEAGEAPAGRHTITIDGRAENGEPLSDGVYFYRIRSAAALEMGRLVIVR